MSTYEAKKVKNFFDKFAEEEAKSLHSKELRVLLPRYFIKKFMPKRGLALDAGGGSGNETILMAKNGLYVVLLDISPKLISIAKKNAKKNKVLDSVSFFQADITDLLMIPDETFDFVVCVGDSISCCVSNYNKAIKELVRVAKKNAILLIGIDSKLGAIINAVRKGKIHIAEEIDKTSEFNEMGPTFKVRCFLPDEIIGAFKKHSCSLIQSFSLSPLSDRFVISKHYKNKNLFKRLLRLEIKYSSSKYLLGSGDHFLFVFKKIR